MALIAQQVAIRDRDGTGPKFLTVLAIVNSAANGKEVQDAVVAQLKESRPYLDPSNVTFVGSTLTVTTS
jgi:mannitol-1-phosphate/altronate dehydrogenase